MFDTVPQTPLDYMIDRERERELETLLVSHQKFKRRKRKERLHTVLKPCQRGEGHLFPLPELFFFLCVKRKGKGKIRNLEISIDICQSDRRRRRSVNGAMM